MNIIYYCIGRQFLVDSLPISHRTRLALPLQGAETEGSCFEAEYVLERQ